MVCAALGALLLGLGFCQGGREGYDKAVGLDSSWLSIPWLFSTPLDIVISFTAGPKLGAVCASGGHGG